MMLPLQYFLISTFASTASTTIFGLGATTPPAGNLHQFNVYWNVPTFMCHNYGIKFEELKNFGIHQNAGDSFRGDQIAILYDPGMFPALLTDKKEVVVKRNGGVPQEGNLAKHLEIFRKHLITQIPNESFSGIGVIDFESWRPIFRQNWGSLEDYKTLSIKLEREQHPMWSDSAIKKEAKRRFEKYGRIFMEETLKTAKKLRPKGSWGYYGYPHCFNHQPDRNCDRQTIIENDEISWLFKLEDVYLPSIYLRQSIKESDRVIFVKSRVSEALRLAQKNMNKQTLPYCWFKYQDHRDSFLTEKDMENAIRTIANVHADGLIIWGSSEDVNSEKKCKDLRQYVIDILGPAIKQYTQK